MELWKGKCHDENCVSEKSFEEFSIKGNEKKRYIRNKESRAIHQKVMRLETSRAARFSRRKKEEPFKL